jgi:hypothetical protein
MSNERMSNERGGGMPDHEMNRKCHRRDRRAGGESRKRRAATVASMNRSSRTMTDASNLFDRQTSPIVRCSAPLYVELALPKAPQYSEDCDSACRRLWLPLSLFPAPTHDIAHDTSRFAAPVAVSPYYSDRQTRGLTVLQTRLGRCSFGVNLLFCPLKSSTLLHFKKRRQVLACFILNDE